MIPPEDFGLGYVVETFYDQPSAEVFLLAGAAPGRGGDKPPKMVGWRQFMDAVYVMYIEYNDKYK